MEKFIHNIWTRRFLLSGLFGYVKGLVKFLGDALSFEYGVIFC